MKTTTTKMSFTLLPLLLAVAAALGGCEPETPAMPSYEKDVRPIFLSHCIRCHGAGGTLQGDPPQYPLGEDQRPARYNPGPPGTCYLNTYADQGDCTPVGGVAPATCKLGAHSCAALVAGFALVPEPSMPPQPAPVLTDWEKEVVRRWVMDPRP